MKTPNETAQSTKVLPTRNRLRLDWADALKGLRDKYTSVELQHETLDYWAEAAIDECPSAAAIRRQLGAVGSANGSKSGDSDKDIRSTRSAPRRRRGKGHDHASGPSGKTRR
jgi:hypothetical protein